MLFKALFAVTRALFRVLCLGVSVSTFVLCIKCAETCAATGRTSCRSSCRSWMCMTGTIRHTPEFLRAWAVSCSFVVYLDLLFVIGAVGHTGREWLIRSHSSARFCFELSGNLN